MINKQETSDNTNNKQEIKPNLSCILWLTIWRNIHHFSGLAYMVTTKFILEVEAIKEWCSHANHIIKHPSGIGRDRQINTEPTHMQQGFNMQKSNTTCRI